jgi:deoxyribonuclease-4
MPIFGVARVYGKDINSFLQKLREQSVDAYEIGFAYGVRDDISEETVKLADNLGIKLSAHAPFFMSWSSEEKIQNSVEHILKGINFAARLHTITVYHMGYYGGKSFEELRLSILNGIDKAVKRATENYNFGEAVIGIETTGKKHEVGSLDEVSSLVNSLSQNVAIPVIDWAHIFARSDGKFPRKTDDFRRVLSKLETEIGLKRFYFHASGIDYKDGNEKKHQSVKTCKPPLPYLFAVLNEAGYDYTVIVESPEAIDDVLWLREVSKNPEAWFEFVQEKMGASGHQTQLAF